MWSIVGAVFAVAIGCLAWYRNHAARSTFYAGHVYGMTAATHRAYAAASFVFALAFGAAIVFPRVPAVPLLAVYTVIAILYVSSFVRGATGEDE